MQNSKGIYIFSLLGLFLGLWLDKEYFADNMRVIYYLFPVLYALLFAFTYNGKNILRLAVSSFIVASFLSIPTLPFYFGEDTKHLQHFIYFLFGYPIFIYIPIQLEGTGFIV